MTDHRPMAGIPRRPPSRVFSLTTGADTAGVGIGIKRAFDRFSTSISVRSMVATVNYIEYPRDVIWSKLNLQRHWDAADVVQIHGTLHAHDWYDETGKPTVLMHHGLGEGDRYQDIVARARDLGIVQIGSTLDLSAHEPDVTWIGPPVDIGEMLRFRSRYQSREEIGDRPIRIGHAPTNAAIKGTAAFIAATDRLALRHRIEVVLIQGIPWIECLKRKATCDILFDQPILGYGVNAIEAWAMGMPVIAGVRDARVREAMLETWGVLPFVEATEDSIEGVLEQLIVDEAERNAMTSIGASHVDRWHSQKSVVRRLEQVYLGAGPTTPGEGIRRLTPHQIRKVSRLSPEMQLRA